MHRAFAQLPAWALVLLLASAPALAQENQNVHAQLSWNTSTTSPLTDLTTPGALNYLYILLTDNVTNFAGAEIDLHWVPEGDGIECYSHDGTAYRTGVDCTYLNRGSAVPVIDTDLPGHLHVAWTTTTANTDCTSGAIIQVQLGFGGCDTLAGVFQLCSLTLRDGNGQQSIVAAERLGVPATVLGGGGLAPPCSTPAASIVVRAPAGPLNRLDGTAEPYPITFQLVGDVDVSHVRTSDVRLAYGTSSVTADPDLGLVIDGGAVTVFFERSELVGLLGAVASGSTVEATLVVTVDGEEYAGTVPITVTGVPAYAAIAGSPSPFRDAMTVRYAVPEDARVSLGVYAADGRLVRTLVTGRTPAGFHTTLWDGRTDAGQRAPGGIYYLWGTIGAARLASRIVLLR